MIRECGQNDNENNYLMKEKEKDEDKKIRKSKRLRKELIYNMQGKQEVD